MNERLGDERGLVVKTLVFVLVSLAVMGAAIVDGGAILFAHVKAADVAQQASFDGATAYRDTGDVNTAEAAAQGTTEQGGAKLVKFSVNTDTGDVTVSVVKKASTFVVQRFGFSKKWGIVRTTDTATPPP